MQKDALVDAVISALEGEGFGAADCRGARSSFDVLARREDTLYLVKVLSNVEGLSRSTVAELERVSAILGAKPLVVASHMKSSKLSDCVLYDRYGVCVCTPETFAELIGGSSPSVYSTRGNYCVHVKATRLSRARKAKGFTQEELARKVGVSKQSIYRYEHSGTMSRDIFERLEEILGGGLAESVYSERFESHHRVRNSSGACSNVTSLKKLVYSEFKSMGFDTRYTKAPFDMVAESGERVYSVVSNDYRRIREKLTMIEELSSILGGYSLCISERRIRDEGTVLSPKELSEVPSPKELFKILSE